MVSDVLNNDEIKQFVAMALREDIGRGDATSQWLVPEGMTAHMRFNAREPMVACGLFIPALVYGMLDTAVTVREMAQEGQKLETGQALVHLEGPARALLTGERVALNIMQHMCGIATLTAAFVAAVEGTGAVILDTRKTIPGMRLLAKHAVRSGGGKNHRIRLDDMVLIKDNHIALCGSIAAAVETARKAGVPVVVECDTLVQLEEALEAMPDRIMLDNMDVATMRRAVAFVAGKLPLEASGGVSLETVREIALAGVDYISVGRLTHSVKAADIGADITLEA